MQLTRFTDFSLRVLIHLGSQPDAQATVAGIAAEHGISRHHLTHVVHQLGLKGYIETTRGKGGGFAWRAAPIRSGLAMWCATWKRGSNWRSASGQANPHVA